MSNRNLRVLLTNELDIIRNKYVERINEIDSLKIKIGELEENKKTKDELIVNLETETRNLRSENNLLKDEINRLHESSIQDNDIYKAYSELSTNFRSIIYDRDDYMLKYNDENKLAKKCHNSMIKYKRMSSQYDSLIKNNELLQKSFIKEFQKILLDNDYTIKKKDLILGDILDITKKIIKK